MKKLLTAILLAALAVALCACGSQKASVDPMVAKWVMLSDDGSVKALISIEEVGDMDVTVWRRNADGDLEQSEDYAGSCRIDRENGVIVFILGDDEYPIDYVLAEGESLTVTYDSNEYIFKYSGSNNAAK